MKEIFKSGDILRSTRCFLHKAWDLPGGASWQETLERAVVLVGSYVDIGLDDPVEWNREWELSARYERWQIECNFILTLNFL